MSESESESEIAADPISDTVTNHKRLSIAFVSQYFFPEQFSVNAIVEDLVERGHDVNIVTGVPNYGQKTFFDGFSNSKRRTEVWRGARVYRARSAIRGEHKLQLFLNYITFPITGSWTALRKLRDRPDVIFASLLSPVFQAFPAILLARWHRTPLVFWVQDIWPESAIYTLNLKNPLLTRPLHFISGWIYRRADMVLVQSSAFPPMITRFGVPSNRVRVLPNTAPPMYRPIQRQAAREVQALIPPARFVVMFAGNIGESQNFDALLEAASLLKNEHRLKWIIIGSGRDFNRVRAKTTDMGLDAHVSFLGRHPEEMMPYFFAHADALLVSLKENDIFNLTVPYKVTCYMACGKPLLAAIAGEGARVVKEANAGIVVSPDNSEELASAIHKLMAMTVAERDEMGAQAQKFYEANYERQYVYSMLESALLEVYECSRKADARQA